MEPKVFISYSWTNPTHQELVHSWADRLLADGIDVILDIYDLKEGNDKYVFMEQMVTDDSVSHVLIVCDKGYKEKADNRKAGVGTESQIISQEVYEKVDQSKFIPIVCEFDEEGNPALPTFLQSRIGINFSSPEAVNDNWEQLVRLLYGKPQYTKPERGQAPTYITSDTPVPTNNMSAKLNSLRQAILQERKRIIKHNRRDFIEACVSYADELRVREKPTIDSIGEKVLEDANKLKLVRDPLVNWVLLESESTPENEFSEVLLEFLEKLRELKSRPAEVTSSNDDWFEAHSVFVYEVFLYFVAALLKTQSYKILHEIYTAHYLPPATERYRGTQLERFDSFYGHSETLQAVLAPQGRQLSSPAAELLQRHADRQDLPFSEIIQAELLTVLMSLITPDTYFWFPQTLYYSPYDIEYPFFIKAAQHKHFMKLAIITGIEDANILRSKVKEENERMNGNVWRQPGLLGKNYWSLMNMDKLDTLK